MRRVKIPLWPFRRTTTANDLATPSALSERVLSILSPDEMHSLGGLPAEGIAGGFAGEMSVDAFRPNSSFVDFMHHVIRTAAPKDPGLQATAREQGEGWVYLIDLRTPEGPHGRVPPEDIIGAFEVRNGRIIADSYEANVKHRVYTKEGLVRLSPFLHRAFVERLPKVSRKKAIHGIE